jgi:hypothetical protein
MDGAIVVIDDVEAGDGLKSFAIGPSAGCPADRKPTIGMCPAGTIGAKRNRAAIWVQQKDFSPSLLGRAEWNLTKATSI